MSKCQSKNDASVRSVGNPNWYKGMPQSPHPVGRPKGSSTTTKLMQRMLEDADGVVDAVISRALEGDTGAASLIISRILPTIRTQTEKTQFYFDAAAPIALQVEQVLSAISKGEVAADVGKQIIDAIGALSQIRAAEELEERISKLEEKQI